MIVAEDKMKHLIATLFLITFSTYATTIIRYNYNESYSARLPHNDSSFIKLYYTLDDNLRQPIQIIDLDFKKFTSTDEALELSCFKYSNNYEYSGCTLKIKLTGDTTTIDKGEHFIKATLSEQDSNKFYSSLLIDEVLLNDRMVKMFTSADGKLIFNCGRDVQSDMPSCFFKILLDY